MSLLSSFAVACLTIVITSALTGTRTQIRAASTSTGQLQLGLSRGRFSCWRVGQSLEERTAVLGLSLEHRSNFLLIGFGPFREEGRFSGFWGLQGLRFWVDPSFSSKKAGTRPAPGSQRSPEVAVHLVGSSGGRREVQKGFRGLGVRGF